MSRSRTIDLAGAPFFVDALTVLDYIAAHEPVAETPRKNLKRAAVAELWPRLTLPALLPMLGDREGRPPRDEDDACWLPHLRLALEFARLTTRRKGIRISARGRDLAQPERAGALDALPFRTVFQRLNLQIFDGDRQPGIQQTLGYTLLQLQSCAPEIRIVR